MWVTVETALRGVTALCGCAASRTALTSGVGLIAAAPGKRCDFANRLRVCLLIAVRRAVFAHRIARDRGYGRGGGLQVDGAVLTTTSRAARAGAERSISGLGRVESQEGVASCRTRAARAVHVCASRRPMTVDGLGGLTQRPPAA